MNKTAYIRYSIAIVALMLAFAVSVRYSERGLLFESSTPAALADVQLPAGAGGYDLTGMTVVNRVILNLRDSYVEPERIEPPRMLVRALDRIQNTVPQVVALFDADMDANPTRVEVRVGAASETFALSEIDSLWQMSFKLRDIFRFLQANLNDPSLDLRDVEYAAVNGMLYTLDPHSALLSPRVFEEMQTQNRGSFGGLGIVISLRDGQLTVISPMPNTPASRAGFRAGDRIVKINDESTVNMPLDEAVSRLRGPIGSSVQVEVMRQGWTEPHAFSLERESISIASVTSQALGDGIGYIKINSFQDNTHADMVAALESLGTEMGGLRGLVLDVRNNPGGLLQQAIRISDTFLSEGTIVTTVGHADRLRDENVANRAGTEPTYPIVVLVNTGSASASEIVAGALKNHNRAIVVGEQTFGKGSVQILNPFPDGSALKLTVAQYLTPGDISIQGVGIVPDIHVYPVSITDTRIDLYPGESTVREGDLEASLTSERLAEAGTASAEIRYYQEPEEFDPNAIEDPEQFDMDFEIRFARDLLLGAGETWERTEMLGRVQPVLDRISNGELRTIQERLRNRDVDWTAGANVVQPVTLTVTSNRPNHEVEAGDPLEVTLSVTNNGDRPLHRVRGVSRSAYTQFDDLEFVFGRVEPGESRRWTVTMTVPQEDPTRVEAISFRVWADAIPLEARANMDLFVQGVARPHWGLTYAIDDDASGNGDGLLQVGETVTFLLDITNTGVGDAGETSAILRNQSDRAVFLQTGRAEFAGVGTGATVQAPFTFEVRERPEGGSLEFTAEVFDSTFREYLRETITIPVEESPRTTEVVEGWVRTRSEVLVHAGAADHTAAVATASAGAVVAIDRRGEGWLRVRWPNGMGWIRESVVETQATGTATSEGIARHILFQPPMIQFGDLPAQTRDPEFELRATILDDREVQDYYIVLSNLVSERRMQSVKRYYEHVGAPSAEVVARLPLRPGMNRITVVARDDQQAISSKVVFVYRHE